MSNIKFVSHEEFPEDQYTKELVYLCIDDKYRVAYVRKQAKNGGMYWGTVNVTATKGGMKQYFESFMQDSTFLEKDIKSFLDKRSWETKQTLTSAPSYQQEEIPF